MKKQLLLLVVLLLPMIANADKSGSCGRNLTWTLDESTGTLTIEGIGAMYDYDYDSYPWYKDRNNISTIVIGDGVTNIGSYAFYSCSGLTSIFIPNSVTSIGNSAFSNCSSFTSFTIPNSVTSIGNSAFSNCKGLTSITIPNSVTNIGYRAFEYCHALTSVTIPNSVTSIGSSAFASCYTLKKVIVSDVAAWCGIKFGNESANPLFYAKHLYSDENTEIKYLVIPNNVTIIGSYAFYSCSGLTSVTIPNSVTRIGSSAFQDCSSFTSVTIPNSVTSIGSSAFYNCSGLTSITIPNSVTSIGSSAFANCSSFTSITIPNSMTSIGNSAFSGCDALKKVIVSDIAAWCSIQFGDESANPLYFAKHLYSDENTEIKNLVIPYSVTSIGDYTFYGCYSFTSVTIPNSVTSIGWGAFYGCTGLTYVTIPNSVTSIGINAFSDCHGLTSVTIPNSVTSISWGAFRDCISLTSITIPNSVTSIGDNAFNGCRGLISVTIPNSVTSIGSFAFHECKALKKVIVSDIAAWCGIQFGSETANPLYYAKHLYSDDNTEIKDLVIPNNVTSIANYAFYRCSSFTSVTLGNNVTSIGDKAFDGCSSFTSVTIPSSVTNIGKDAFQGCDSISDINITVTDFTAFCNNKVIILILPMIKTSSNVSLIDIEGNKIQEYVIPAGVKSIGDYAFYGCRGLTSVTIANNVKSIGNRAFYGCKDLTSVTIGNSVKSIGINAFDEVDIPTIISLMETPCTINDKTSSERSFSKNTFNNAILYVPMGTINKYKSKGGWRDFAFIEEGDPSGIEQPLSNTKQIKIDNGLLTIQNIKNGTLVSVYNANGTFVGSTISQNEQAIIDTNMQPSSVAIVKIGEQSVKVIIK